MPSRRLYILIGILMLLGSHLNAYGQTAPDEDTSPKQPDWQVCNETSFILDIAKTAVPPQDEGANLRISGWHVLRSGQCQIMSAKKGTPRYIYARSAALHQGGIREWKGRHAYCIGEGMFTLAPTPACELQGLKTAEFLRVIPTEETTTFVEPANFGKKAETAGLQRLLKDNNYGIKRIDGVGGRRTSKTLKAFLKDNGINTNLSLKDKLTALEKSAQDIHDTVGITLCNQTNMRIWSAIAYNANNNWQSLGWWPIEPKACERPLIQNLKGMKAHIYARQETQDGKDKILKVTASTSAAKPKEFCIGESGFSAVHHEICRDQGYVPARFKAITNVNPDAKITFTDNDFGPASDLR